MLKRREKHIKGTNGCMRYHMGFNVNISLRQILGDLKLYVSLVVSQLS